MRNIFKQILFAILLLLIQLPSFAEEVTELYLVRNSHLKDVKDISDFYSRQNNLIVKSQDSYSVSYITDREYFVAYFEQAGKDVYFYYYSPSENKYSYKDIVSRLKNKNYSCKREKNKPTKQIFYNKVMSISETSKLSEQKKQEYVVVSSSPTVIYDFSDSAQEKYNQVNQVLANRPQQPYQIVKQNEENKKNYINQEKDNYVTIPETKPQQKAEVQITSGKYDIPGGLTINAEIQSDIETSSLAQNDRISAILQNDLYVNNKLKAKAGSIVYGNVTEVKKAGRGYKNGSLVLQFDTMLTTDGEKLTFKTEKCNFEMPDNSRAKKIAGQVTGRALAGALGGVLTGLITAAFSSGVSYGQGIGYGAAIGAGAGALTGAVSAGMSKGEEVSLTEGTSLILKTVSD